MGAASDDHTRVHHLQAEPLNGGPAAFAIRRIEM
jgi:hypothetical protein